MKKQGERGKGEGIEERMDRKGVGERRRGKKRGWKEDELRDEGDKDEEAKGGRK